MTKETLIKELNETLEHIQATSKDLVKEDSYNRRQELICLYGRACAINELLKDPEKISIEYCEKIISSLVANREDIISNIKHGCRIDYITFMKDYEYCLFFEIGQETIFDFVKDQLKLEKIFNASEDYEVIHNHDHNSNFSKWIKKLEEQK